MHAHQLLAKLTRPRLHGAVARDRLFATLDAAQQHRPAICVVGPPGAGKTTLVASWLDARDAHGIWYQIDPGDGDMATFFHYLGAAAEPYARKGHAPLPALTPEYLKDIEGFSRRYFRELFSRLPEAAVLVLDNYQEVAPEQALHGLIAQAVDEVPSGAALVVISRRDPPDTYARLIANEHVELVDWDQLRLTLDEARSIVGARLALTESEIAQLHEQSDGWAAGLTLMVEGRRRDGTASIRLPAGRDAIFDYFAAQIFARVEPGTQRFLVTTALLPQVPVSIARDLTGNTEAGAILEDLYRRHLFTHRRPGAEPAYWYHALFREFLKGRAEIVLGTSATHELRRRAARLLEASGAFDGAFDLFREAADWPAAARLIERQAAELLAQGRGQTLREWTLALPAETLGEQPWLRYWLGTSLAPIDQPTARYHLERAFHQFEASGELTGQALAAAGLIDTYLFEWTDFRPVRRWVDALDALMDRLHVADTPAVEQRIYSSFMSGLMYVAPGHPRLLQCVMRVTEMLDEQLSVNSKLAAATMLLAYCNIASDADRATIAVTRGRSLAESLEITPFSLCWWNLRLGYFHTHAGRYEESIAALDKAAEIVTGHGFQYLVNMTSLLFSYRSIATASKGDIRATRLCCNRVVAVAEGRRPMPRWHAAQAHIYESCVSGNLAAVAEQGAVCIALAKETGMIYVEVLAGAHHAIGLAASGQRRALAERLAQQRTLIRDTCFAYFEVEAALVEAWDMLVHESRPRGRELLAAALRLARDTRAQHGNIFRATSIFRELLAEAFDAGIETGYATDVVRRLGVSPPPQATDRWPWPLKVYTLGRFEVHVDSTLLTFVGKVPRKPLTLLKAIIAFGETGVPAATLVDALWSEEEGDAARKSLDITIARLRKLLGHSEAILVSDEAVTLNPRLCWVDARGFLELTNPPGLGSAAGDAARRACALHAGPFLPADLDLPWTMKRREQLRGRFIRLVEEAGLTLESDSRWLEAIAQYRGGIDADDLAETFHQGLMRCYRALGRNAEAMSAYRRLRQTLSVTLGIAPSQQSRALAESLQRESPSRDQAG